MRFALNLLLMAMLSAAVAEAQERHETGCINADSLHDVQVRTFQGGTFWGKFVREDDSTAVYETSAGRIALKKDDILSTTSWTNIDDPGRTKCIVKEYTRLPLLGVALFGAALSYSSFAKASELSKSDKPRSGSYIIGGLAAGALTCLLVNSALTPTFTVMEKPVTLLPASNGVLLSVHL